MACSKFSVNVPSKWLDLVRKSLHFPVNNDLYAYDQLVETCLKCGIFSGRDMVKTFCDSVTPYRIMQSLFSVVPNDELCREAFKVFVHHTVVLFRADDLLEVVSGEQIKIACHIFAKLDEKCRTTFPNFPTIQEMKIITELEDQAIISPTIALINSTVDVAKMLLNYSSCSLDAVFNARQRMSNAILLHLKSMLAANTGKIKGDVLDTLWHRAFEGGAIPYIVLSEILAGSIGETQQFMHIIQTIGLLHATAVTPVNDVYSYEKEEDFLMYNFFGDILKESNGKVEESVEKAAKISDALHKRLYRRIKETKASYPDRPKLHSILESFENFATGACVMHWWLIPRYHNSSTKCTFVEIGDEEFLRWLEENEEYGESYVDKYEEMLEQRLNGGILAALCGNIVVNPASDSRQEIGNYYLD